MFSIIIPTYNEKKNILELINRIEKIMPKNEKYEIIVVDDNSPDKTWSLVERLEKNI
jgi:dolichol-phosphate mannosyltransferase